MHYFTINTAEDNQHIGFLVMLPDDGGEHDAPHGQFAIKLADPDQISPLTPWADNTELRWAIHQDHVQLFDETGELIGSIRQQHLKLAGQHFTLNDLTGMI